MILFLHWFHLFLQATFVHRLLITRRLLQSLNVILVDLICLAPSMQSFWVIRLRFWRFNSWRTILLHGEYVVIGVLVRTVIKLVLASDPQSACLSRLLRVRNLPQIVSRVSRAR